MSAEVRDAALTCIWYLADWQTVVQHRLQECFKYIRTTPTAGWWHWNGWARAWVNGSALTLDGFWFPHVPSENLLDAEVLSKSMRRSVRFQSWLLAHSWERWAIEETRDIMPSQSVLKPSRDWRSWFSGGRNADSMWHRPCWCRICKQGFVLSTVGLSFMVALWWFWIGFTTLLDLPWHAPCLPSR